MPKPEVLKSDSIGSMNLGAVGKLMKRREFIAGVGATAAWPFAVKAQQGESKKRIGVLIARPENDAEGQSYVVAFEQALAQTGWKPGRNVEIDYRWTAGSAPLDHSPRSAFQRRACEAQIPRRAAC